MPKCPICQAHVEIKGGKVPASFPFCSERCRNVDLYRWCHEEYSVPVETNRVAQQALDPSAEDPENFPGHPPRPN